MADKPIELQDKDASDQVVTASGSVDRVITDRGPRGGSEKQMGSRVVQVPHVRGKGFGVSTFDSSSTNPNDRLSLADDPYGERNGQAHNEFRAQHESEVEAE